MSNALLLAYYLILLPIQSAYNLLISVYVLVAGQSLLVQLCVYDVFRLFRPLPKK